MSHLEARRVALAAQGFGTPRPARRPDLRALRRLGSMLGVIQVDAVSVLIRAHYLPAFSRLGVYDVRLLDKLVYRDRAMFEYVAHAASFVATDLQPCLRWRMAATEAGGGWARAIARIQAERPGYVDAVLREVADRGPLAFTDLADPARREKVPSKYADSSVLWERWSDGKDVLDWLHLTGRLAVAGRRGFERLYDLTERVLPAEVLATPTPPLEDAQRTLVRAAAHALGVATVPDVADYFRLPVAITRARLSELVADGDLEMASVEGWPAPAFVVAGARAQPIAASTLLSPFDSVVWERARLERLFGFRYRIEIYVPPAKRQHGYFVLPYLLGDRLVARVDLAADRKRSRLVCPGAFIEAGVPRARVAAQLAKELRRAAAWLELDGVEIGGRGDLAADLAKVLP